MKRSKQVLINSELNPHNDKLVEGGNSEFTYVISNASSYSHVIVLGCSIPVSYYIVQERYNTFTLVEGNDSVEITVPAGNYNTTSFLNTVKKLLNSNSPNQYVYNMTFPNDFTGNSTGRYVFTVEGYNTEPSIVIPADSELHKQFGFDHGSTNTFVNGTMTSTSIVDFIIENTLTIWSDICDDNNLLTIFSNNVVPFSKLGFQCDTDLYAKRISASVNNTYRFALLSGAGSRIDLNGLGMTINLLLFEPDDETYKQDLKNYIKYKVS